MSRGQIRRLAPLAVLNWTVLQGMTVLLGMWRPLMASERFTYLLLIGGAAKACGDLLYFIANPARKRWRYVDDYLLNDLLTHIRFVLPMAIAQAWLAIQGPILLAGAWSVLNPVVVSPLPGVILWLINRSLIEQAEDGRARIGGMRAANLGREPRPPADERGKKG